MKKFVDVVSDREIHKILTDIDYETIWDSLWEMWRDDLTVDMDKPQLIHGANSILAYFGASAKVTDVDWDMEGDCFLWEVQGHESTT